MYVAAPAFLPSSFAMYLGMLALGAWFKKDYAVSITVCIYSYASYVATGDPGKVLSLDTLYIPLYIPIPDFPRICGNI